MTSTNGRHVGGAVRRGVLFRSAAVIRSLAPSRSGLGDVGSRNRVGIPRGSKMGGVLTNNRLKMVNDCGRPTFKLKGC
jgi:hypothetical protein